ncbi:hypothetical protein OOZ15_11575 [Galbibacter sp. EGI 63066]|uniref:hypothetical protein n=1 Tax=Galbibacter sp. EGI 63066 TaxID=2993559 RepID=UPI002248F4F4|nr:hypothetical protein [Galbibacter sp. EGI 63066]MCX2680582.1 hypothetical protein [Galbibacter sp. EGI 63066]
MKSYLRNEAYKYYPKGVNGLDDTYMKRKEIKNLKEQVGLTSKKEYGEWVTLINKFNNQSHLNAIDKTNFTINQSSMALQIILKSERKFSLVFSCYCSFLIPYFYFIETIHDSSTRLILDYQNINRVTDKDIKRLINNIKLQFGRKIMNEDYLFFNIPNLSFETIPFGKFNVQKAFFNSKHLML